MASCLGNEISQKVILKCGEQLVGEFEKLSSNGGGKGKRFRIYFDLGVGFGIDASDAGHNKKVSLHDGCAPHSKRI